MKSPLKKRIGRELKQDFGKYLVIFLFITLTIGFISGFLVADNSMTSAYDESFAKYNIEDGNFELTVRASNSLLDKTEEKGIEVYENFYREISAINENTTLRIFGERDKVNLVCLMEGIMPKENNEIALDRLFAENNHISVGDAITLGNEDFTVTAFVALSDYSTQFQNNSDMMFDATNFGVAVVTKAQFDTMTEGKLHYLYSWKNLNSDLTNNQKRDLSDDIMELLVKEQAGITGIVPAVENQAITFTGDDMGSDKSMMEVLLYVIMVILAFIFGITIANSIEKEASEIGTLRALGYTRWELLVHYLSLPVIVTLISCVLGNVLGYTVFKNVVVDMYYHSYSLPTYETLWNPYAFVITTIVPCVMMIVINTCILWLKLKLSPLKFLRHDLNSWKAKKAVKLPPVSFINRFRMRILIQNKANYLVMFIGITFANVLIFFGLLMSPLLDHFGEQVKQNMISENQYVLKVQADTKEESAEKYAVNNLVLDMKDRELTEEITVYGIQENSEYIKGITLESEGNGVYVSHGIMEKYKLSIGDTIKLKDKYSNELYEVKIKGSYNYPASFAVFMSQKQFCDFFDREEGYFNGYFSDEKITDIDDAYIATNITFHDMTKIVRQLKDSMGAMFPMITVFSVSMAILVFYLLSKIVIEKNASAISMIRILGYNGGEISRLYMMSTTITAILSIVLSLGIAAWAMRFLYYIFMNEMSGWLTYYVAPANYLKAVLLGLAAYGISALLQYRKIAKVRMEEALKKVDM